VLFLARSLILFLVLVPTLGLVREPTGRFAGCVLKKTSGELFEEMAGTEIGAGRPTRGGREALAAVAVRRAGVS
jgi:hypothetical protein